MEIDIKEIRKKYSKKPPILLSQRELIKRINQFTQNSYKYFDLLVKRK